jgi:PAS domain S-box-containing protein
MTEQESPKSEDPRQISEQAEANLRQSEQTALQFQQQLIALQKISIELTKAETLDELCRQAVEMVCNQLDFDRLSIWFFDEKDPEFMIGSYGIDENGNLRDERHQRRYTGPGGGGDGSPPTEPKIRTWQRHVLYDDHHQAVGEGWSAIAPLLRGEVDMGFMSTDNLIRKRPFSHEMLELLGLYATTLSHLIAQKQAEIKAQHRRDMLEKVVGLGKQVTQVVDFRDCLLRIYELIQKGLDFDRIGLFVIDEKQQVAQAAYGTDREGNRTEEWDIIIPLEHLTDIAPTGEAFLPSDSLLFIQDYEEHFELREGKNAEDMAGVKQYVRIISWVGERPVLIINTDNLVTQRTITEEQVEALYLFSGYASLAIENARLLAKVQAAEHQYRSIFEHAIEGIFQIAPQGQFLSANPALAHMLGYDYPAQLFTAVTDIGSQLYVDPERAVALRQRLEAKEQVQNFEFEVWRRDGSRAWLSQNVQAVYDEQGAIVHLEGTVQDITDRKLAEEERESLIQELERRNAELERFTYTVSHDLKSPLITIRGFLGYVERDALAGKTDRLRGDIKKINKAALQMQQFMDELLELSRIGRVVNPAEVILFSCAIRFAIPILSSIVI